MPVQLVERGAKQRLARRFVIERDEGVTDERLHQEEAVALIVNGFARDVLKELPMEFAVEAQKLLAISLEGSVG